MERVAAVVPQVVDTVRTEMNELRFNTAIAKLIELNNGVTKLDSTPREVAEPMVQMLAPLVPHLAEELWRRLGHDETITYVEFPVADPALLPSSAEAITPGASTRPWREAGSASIRARTTSGRCACGSARSKR